MKCPEPRIENGIYRKRPRSRLIKFMCYPGFELVGNRYATCRVRVWDVKPPICAKPGCPHPETDNGVFMSSHNGAILQIYCFPGYIIVGSLEMYCNGTHWNTSPPKCVATAQEVKYSCDFEDEQLCGWVQDELHDFDWRWWSGKTPSSFLFTGPSSDHTLGPNGRGHYMYIESTSRQQNDTARLISPLYNGSISANGCFRFFYHMYGRDTGGLRVYQKPENVELLSLLNMPETDKQKYILFEQWGDHDDIWYSAVLDLTLSLQDFQIVFEGIRGFSVTSDIAIDDVAIMHGQNCTDAKQTAITPKPVVDSCSGRCAVVGSSNKDRIRGICGCSVDCIVMSNCCADFIEFCIDNDEDYSIIGSFSE